MKTKVLFSAAFLFFLIPFSPGQTIIDGGDVFGTWTKSSAPYLVRGEINVPLDETLTIEPGVEVNFEGYYKFNIYGCLIAEGTLVDSIVFTTDDTGTGWHGLRFQDTRKNNQPVSKITYCVVEYGISSGSCPNNRGAGIYILRSDPVISHSCIRNNRAETGAGEWGGGGIYCEYAGAVIENNLITNNYSGHDGGGIYCNSSSPVISNNKILNNEASFRGGGIATFIFSSPDILNNEIAGNYAGSFGGGIYQSGGKSLIQSNIIRENSSGKGGGIANYLSQVQGVFSKIFSNLIADNEASYGGGIWNQGSSNEIFNNTIVRNNANLHGGGMYNMQETVGPYIYYSDPMTANNIFYFNTADEGQQIHSLQGNVPVLWYNDIEGLAEDGITGEYDEKEGNVDITPGFDSEAEHDCELLGGSACIDNGANSVDGIDLPETDILGNVRIWDGDNDGQAVADMGAYEYGSSPLGMHEIQTGDNTIVLIVSPNPFSASVRISFQLENSMTTMISLRDLHGRIIKTLLNENFCIGRHEIMFDFGNLTPGIYILYLQTSDGEVAVKKIIKYK